MRKERKEKKEKKEKENKKENKRKRVQCLSTEPLLVCTNHSTHGSSHPTSAGAVHLRGSFTGGRVAMIGRGQGLTQPRAKR